MTTTTDKLAAALLECADYLAEFMEEGREHRVIRAADDALLEHYGVAFVVAGPIDDTAPSGVGERLYWNNMDGWGSRDGATVFFDVDGIDPIESTGREFIKGADA